MADWGQFGAGFLSGFAGTLESGLREKWRRDWYDERERRERGYKLADWEKEKEWTLGQWEREKDWAEEQADVKQGYALDLLREKERIDLEEARRKEEEEQRAIQRVKQQQENWYQSLTPEQRARVGLKPGAEGYSTVTFPAGGGKTDEELWRDAMKQAANELGGQWGKPATFEQIFARANQIIEAWRGGPTGTARNLVGGATGDAVSNLSKQPTPEKPWWKFWGGEQQQSWATPGQDWGDFADRWSLSAPRTAADGIVDVAERQLGQKFSDLPENVKQRGAYELGREGFQQQTGTTPNVFDYGKAMQIVQSAGAPLTAANQALQEGGGFRWSDVGKSLKESYLTGSKTDASELTDQQIGQPPGRMKPMEVEEDIVASANRQLEQGDDWNTVQEEIKNIVALAARKGVYLDLNRIQTQVGRQLPIGAFGP